MANNNNNNNQDEDNLSDDPIIILKKSWCDYFEDEVECPVCYEIPEKNIFQCTQGHSFCHLCIKTIELCPLCNSAFTGTRNRVLEKLIPKILEFKNCLMDQTNEAEKCRRVKKISRSTQTLEDTVETKLDINREEELDNKKLNVTA